MSVPKFDTSVRLGDILVILTIILSVAGAGATLYGRLVHVETVQAARTQNLDDLKTNVRELSGDIRELHRILERVLIKEAKDGK